MRVMVSNNYRRDMQELVKKYPYKLGHLFSPEGWKNPIATYALDNGAYSCYKNGTLFDTEAYYKMIEKAIDSLIQPLWLAVPDVVADREGTLKAWKQHYNTLKFTGIPLCFVVQDGMTLKDIPKEAAIIFIGGTTQWKQQTTHYWCDNFPRVHVGRVNTLKWVHYYDYCGAESVDGTGWWHTKQFNDLVYYMTEKPQDNPHRKQRRLF